MLGFFVAGVLRRFWYLYNIIGWIDNIALLTAMYVRGKTERAIMYRRNIVRYCELVQVLIFRDLSMRCRKRFPTIDTVVAAGYMMPHEKENFDQIQYGYNKYFLAFNWAWALIYRARKEGLIESDYYVKVLSEEVREFRTGLAWLCNYDWVPLPMIYPTIVCLAVHMYFLVCVISRQYVEGSKYSNEIDAYFPFMTSVQFILYMGWLKVAEGLLNPWGEDPDDFETNMLIDRNTAIGLKIVHEGYDKTPELKKDDFWGDDEWVPLYSERSARERSYRVTEGSLANIKLDKSISQVRMVPLGSNRESTPSLLRFRHSIAVGRRSSVKEKVVPVRPEDTEDRPSFTDLRSLLHLPKISSSGSVERRTATPKLSSPLSPCATNSSALFSIGDYDVKSVMENVKKTLSQIEMEEGETGRKEEKDNEQQDSKKDGKDSQRKPDLNISFSL
ncbi:hypothetical protein WR25_22749 [Diploscapter pachys]|uniref:Bestrophin homolog n=1 Tax=Diploscapter pachys TaxID=2018661 RepID=A0A2A2LKA6_9BILA|nr:hypothetical protein WR25_22749 [Diploscapter pachys]